ncbi:MAG: class I SAM-dependent methyltransferase [Candidatus Pacebacteria bacterium]|nr:class I SAM-dependent methyltransferase [Candidatus Paceibacterota bacterium]
MKQFREFITEEVAKDARQVTNLLVDAVYSRYIDDHDKNSIECVGWLDGTENAQLRFQKIYESGIGNNDSILDVGCGVAHLHTFLSNQGWSGKYLGFDPNKKAIDLVDESINAMEGTIEDLPDFMKYDWAISNGVFNLGLKEEHAFWIIENMISHANKGIVFNMLHAPYEDPKYEAYYPEQIKHKLSKFNHSNIEIVEDYMPDDAEFTVYFYV